MACMVGLAATSRGSTHPTALFHDRHGLHGGPRRYQSRLDPPYGTLPRSPQPEMRVTRRDRKEEDSTYTGRGGRKPPEKPMLSPTSLTPIEKARRVP